MFRRLYNIRHLNTFLITLDILLKGGDVDKIANHTMFQSPEFHDIYSIPFIYNNCVNYDANYMERLAAKFNTELDIGLNVQECFCCHRLMGARNMILLKPGSELWDNENVKRLADLWGDKGEHLICTNYCWKDAKNNKVPAYSVLNNVGLDLVPIEIKQLNFFEKQLIQRAKCFQTIIKLRPNRKLFSNHALPALKGNILINLVPN